MAYKPKMKKGAGFGPQGVAKIEVHPKDINQIRFTLKVRTYNKETKQEEVTDTIQGKVNRQDCPEKVQSLIKNGIWFISINDDKDKIYSIRPVEGVFEVVTDRFSAQENQPPTPRTFKGEQWEYQYFTIILKIVDEGEAKGMEIPYTLRYHFDKEVEEVDEKEREVVAYSHPKSKYTMPLVDYCDASGVWAKGAMPFKDNILPMMEKRILEQNRHFQVVMSGGQVKSILGGNQDFSDDFTPEVEK